MIVGSSAFNLAAMVGLSALLVGGVRVRRDTLLLEGGVALAATGIVIALLLSALPAILAAALLALVVVPYLARVVGGPRLASRLHAPWLVARATIETGDDDHAAHADGHFATHRQLGLMGLDVALIVLGSIGMVQAALSLGDRWGIRPALIGVLVLARSRVSPTR